MAPTKTASKAHRSVRSHQRDGTISTGFSAEEKAAARERVRELKAEAAKADGKRSCLRLSPGCRSQIAPLPRRSTH